jgi:hypothetical protein
MVAVLLGHGTEQCNSNDKGEVMADEWAKKTTVHQLFLNIGADIIDVLISGWMVPGSTGRGGGTNNTSVPAIHNAINDRHQIPIVFEKLGPSNQIKLGGYGDTESILICNARIDNPGYKIEALVNKGTT